MSNSERDVELWRNVFGSSGDVWEWYPEPVRFIVGDWDTPGLAKVVIDDTERGFVAKYIDVVTLRETLDLCAGKYFQAGTGEPIHEFMDWDADSADVILQVAVLGELVYG